MSMVKPGASHEDREIDLSMLLGQIRENRWLIFGVILFSYLCSAFYASRQIPQYASSLILQIEPGRQSGVGGLPGQLSQQLTMGGGGSSFEATQIALIKSRVVLATVVNRLGLDINISPEQSISWIKRHIFRKKLNIKVKKFKIPHVMINKPFSLVLDKKNHFFLYTQSGKPLLKGEVGKNVSNHDKTISIFVSKTDAPIGTKFIVSKKLDEDVAGSLRNRILISDLGENRQNTGVLEIGMTDADPKRVVDILNEIGKTIQAKDIHQNAVEASKTLAFLYQQLPITKHDLEKSETALNRYRAKTGKIDMKLQAQYLLNQLTDIEQQLSKLRVEKIDKLQHYTIEHPVLIALNTKVGELQRERDLLESQLKKLPASDQVTVNLMREVEVKNSLYLVLLNKIQELQVVKAGVVSNIRILSLAKLPTAPQPFKNVVLYLSSVLLGLVISLIFIFTRKLIHPRVEDPRWCEQHFNLVNLAIVPYSKEQSASFLRKDGIVPGAQQISLLAHVAPRNLSIESLRSLRTTLQVRLACTTNNIVSILGISPGVGKTFISANLGYLLATSGKRVLLVDTDLRRGTLHKYFNIPPSPGLAEVLNKEKTLSEVIAPTIHENLMIIPRGIYPNDPSELLSGEIFKNILKETSSLFDIVVIDTAPVLLVTDAVLVGVHAGTNYLVLAANSHQPNEIEMTINRLVNAGVTLNGSIFNFHKQTLRSDSAYYNKYGYKYNYYYHDNASS